MRGCFHVGRLSGGDSRPGVASFGQDTTGAIVFIKASSHRSLASSLRRNLISASILAILDGHMATDQLAVESYLHRDPENRLKFNAGR